MTIRDERIPDALVSRTEIGADCWEWRGYRGKLGYGQLSTRRGRTSLAHRLVWEEFVGPIPDGLEIDHLCRNRACVNPDHLEPVTPQENTLRSPIARAALNARKSVCKHGHPFDATNTLVTPLQRSCRACAREKTRRYRERRRLIA